MRQPEHIQALQELVAAVWGGPGVGSAPFVRLLRGVVWDPELQPRYFCMLWAQAPGQPAQQQPCGWSC